MADPQHPRIKKYAIYDWQELMGIDIIATIKPIAKGICDISSFQEILGDKDCIVQVVYIA